MIEQRIFGNTGLRVGVLGLGTAEIGFAGADYSEVDSILSAAADAGINLLGRNVRRCRGSSRATFGWPTGKVSDLYQMRAAFAEAHRITAAAAKIAFGRPERSLASRRWNGLQKPFSKISKKACGD
jgi:hypothetical protein